MFNRALQSAKSLANESKMSHCQPSKDTFKYWRNSKPIITPSAVADPVVPAVADPVVPASGDPVFPITDEIENAAVVVHLDHSYGTNGAPTKFS